MNIRELMNKLDAINDSVLDEGFNYKTIAKEVGGITDVNARHQAVAQIAVKNQLPGLYDPVDGKYVSNQNQVSSTADKDTDYMLASKGLIPPNAATSTTLGRIFGTSGDKYDAGLRGQSDQFVSTQEKEEFKQEKIGQLQDLMAKLMTLKKIPATPAAGTTPAAGSNASNATVNTTIGPPAGAPGGPAAPAQSGTPTRTESVSIAKDLMESFGYTAEAAATAPAPTMGSAARAVAEPIAVGAGGGVASKLLQKATGKAIPLAGAAFGAYDAYHRAKQGDYLGAGIAGLSGAVSLIPGVGWIPALALDAVNLGRDLAADGGEHQDATPSDNPPLTGDQHAKRIIAMQTELKAKGADLGTFGPKGDGIDGKIGKLTKIALGKYPDIAKKYGMGPVQESLSESMRSLRERLRLIEDDSVAPMADQGTSSQPQPIPEPNAELNAMAQQMTSAGGQILKVGDKIVALMPDKTIVDPSTMDILDGSSAQLTPTGEKFTMQGQDTQVQEAGRAVGFFQGLKDLIGAAKTGWHGAPVATGKLTKSGAPQMVGQDSKAFQKAMSARPGSQQAVYKASRFAGKNPKTAAAIATAGGLAVGYGAKKGADAIGNLIGGKEDDPHSGGGGGGGHSGGGATPSNTPAQEPALVCSPEQMDLIGQIKKVMGELGDVAKTDKLVAQVITSYNEKIDAIGCQPAGQGATPTQGGRNTDGMTPLEKQYDQYNNAYRA